MPALWLDASAHRPKDPPLATVLLARDGAGNFAAPGLEGDWPHAGVTRQQWNNLTNDERVQMDAALMTAYAAILKARRLEMESFMATSRPPQASKRTAA